MQQIRELAAYHIKGLGVIEKAKYNRSVKFTDFFHNLFYDRYYQMSRSLSWNKTGPLWRNLGTKVWS